MKQANKSDTQKKQRRQQTSKEAKTNKMRQHETHCEQKQTNK